MPDLVSLIAAQAAGTAAFTLAVWLATRLVRPPRTRHLLWRCCLLKFALPGAVLIPVECAFFAAAPAVETRSAPAGRAGLRDQAPAAAVERPVGEAPSPEAPHALPFGPPEFVATRPSVAASAPETSSGDRGPEAPAVLAPESVPVPPLPPVPGPTGESPRNAARGPVGPKAKLPPVEPVSTPAQSPAASDEGPPAWPESEPAPAVPVAALPVGLTAGPPPTEWLLGLAAVWFVGSATWFGLALGRLHRFRCALRASATPAAPPDAGSHVAELAAQFGLAYAPRLVELPACVPPIVFGSGARATIVVPSALWQKLTQDERAAVLAHEIAHLARGDPWTRWLEFWVLGFFWWHPAAHLARREVRMAEEECCDVLVLDRRPDLARAYAEVLLRTLDFVATGRAAAPSLVSGFSEFGFFKRRLQMILERKVPPRMSPWWWLLVVAAGLGVLTNPWIPLSAQSVPTAESPRTPASGIDAASGTGDLPMAGAFPVDPAPADGVPPTVRERSPGLPRDRPMTVEERLERIERLVERLAAQQAHSTSLMRSGGVGGPVPSMKSGFATESMGRTPATSGLGATTGAPTQPALDPNTAVFPGFNGVSEPAATDWGSGDLLLLQTQVPTDRRERLILRKTLVARMLSRENGARELAEAVEQAQARLKFLQEIAEEFERESALSEDAKPDDPGSGLPQRSPGPRSSF